MSPHYRVKHTCSKLLHTLKVGICNKRSDGLISTQ